MGSPQPRANSYARQLSRFNLSPSLRAIYTHPKTKPYTSPNTAQALQSIIARYPKMPFFIKPFFRKPLKLFAIDADTGKPIDPNVRAKTRVTYYELQNGSNGSQKLVAHKSASQVAKGGGEEEAKNSAKAAEEEGKKAGSKGGGSKKEDAPKDNAAKVEQKGNDAVWTPEEDEKLKAMKAENKSWKIISGEMGRAQHVLKTRFKEIGGAAENDQGKKEANGKGGEGQNDKEKQQGGKQGKKNKKSGDNNQQNDKQKKDTKKPTNEKPNGSKKEDSTKKPHSKKEETPRTSTNKTSSKTSHSNRNDNSNKETRFTISDWLTLQEDDMFSFGELQCLSELIGKDLGQSWQRVVAKFFDLTGRRIHPDDVREKFERMALMAEGRKG